MQRAPPNLNSPWHPPLSLGAQILAWHRPNRPHTEEAKLMRGRRCSSPNLLLPPRPHPHP